jgi:hypothetical protein
MGYFVAKSRLELEACDETRFRFYLPMITVFQGWIISAFLHGLYDFFLSLKMEREAYLLIIIMGCISVWLGKIALRVSRRKVER